MIRHGSLAMSGWLLLSAAVLSLSACKPPPKPKSLQELERILGQPDANEVENAPGAGRYYRESRKLRRAALEAYDERELERAKHFAIRGKLAYRTAEVIATQGQAKRRLEKANAKIENINPKIENLVEERDALLAEVQKLQKKVGRMKAQKSRQSREAEAAAAEEQNQSKRLEAKNAISDTKTHKQRALRVKANQFAKATFNRADNHLKSAQALFSGQTASPQEVIDEAKKASELFEKAQKEAKPKYEESLAKMNPQERLKSLQKDLEFELGGAYVESVGRGVRAIVTDLFRKGGSRIQQNERDRLRELAKIAKEYDEFQVRVEGFTREGNATQNLTVSQVRARNVRDFLSNNGVGDNRLESKGLGQKRLRYPDQPSENDRVELVFKLPSN